MCSRKIRRHPRPVVGQRDLRLGGADRLEVVAPNPSAELEIGVVRALAGLPRHGMRRRRIPRPGWPFRSACPDGSRGTSPSGRSGRFRISGLPSSDSRTQPVPSIAGMRRRVGQHVEHRLNRRLDRARCIMRFFSHANVDYRQLKSHRDHPAIAPTFSGMPADAPTILATSGGIQPGRRVPATSSAR